MGGLGHALNGSVDSSQVSELVVRISSDVESILWVDVNSSSSTSSECNGVLIFGALETVDISVDPSNKSKRYNINNYPETNTSFTLALNIIFYAFKFMFLAIQLSDMS